MSDDGHQQIQATILMYGGIAGVGALMGYCMFGTTKAAWIGAGVSIAWELGWMLHRRSLRLSTYREAFARSRFLSKPLVVVGAPDRGGTNELCGDVVVDIAPSRCPNSVIADVTKPNSIPLSNDSAVVFCSYVLDYVDDVEAALRELRRVGGSNVYILTIEPWTLTAYAWNGAKRALSPGAFAAPPKLLGA